MNHDDRTCCAELRQAQEREAALERELGTCKALLRGSNHEIERLRRAWEEASAELARTQEESARIEAELMKAMMGKDQQLMGMEEEKAQLQQEVDALKQAMSMEAQRSRQGRDPEVSVSATRWEIGEDGLEL
eukprot:TRINITY_DN1629_c0_g1_i2.p2 TRINITY_DN1629_c0_g1~~TRINITY_DN1629_c0_g1_i2.p2  ORF type:complete len:132 (+),score=46.70 TRINITY_DN1629_c0_g1_i2:188-583(+)